MQIIEGILKLAEIYGWISVGVAVGAVIIYFKGKPIGNWIVSTLQAAAIVKQHEQTISELRDEIAELRKQLELYNQKLIEATSTIARLEERLDMVKDVATKRVVRRSRGRKPNDDAES